MHGAPAELSYRQLKVKGVAFRLTLTTSSVGQRTPENVMNLLGRRYMLRTAVKKVKASHTRYRALGPELIPAVSPQVIHSAVGCLYFRPGLRLPSQPQSITAPRPVPSYTAW